MVYKYSKKSNARKGKSTYPRYAGKTSTKSRTSRIDKMVDARIQSALKKARRGPPRSVPVQLTPAHFDRSGDIPTVKKLDKWTTYFHGPSSAMKYGILPITELIPPQRPASGAADDRFRSLDKVTVKAVCLRAVVSYAEGVRLLVFAFRNPTRRDTPPSLTTRPFVDNGTISTPPTKGVPASEIVYEVMSKEKLMGMQEHSFRNLGVHDGPFAVTQQLDERYDWKATDMTAFTSRFNKEDGRPVGTIHAKIDGSKPKAHGSTFKGLFGTSSLMRTNAFDGTNPSVNGWIGSRTKTVELFIKLNKSEKFTVSNGSLSVNERPLELFIGFDSPGSMHAASSHTDVASGAIMSMDMEVYYE